MIRNRKSHIHDEHFHFHCHCLAGPRLVSHHIPSLFAVQATKTTCHFMLNNFKLRTYFTSNVATFIRGFYQVEKIKWWDFKVPRFWRDGVTAIRRVYRASWYFLCIFTPVLTYHRVHALLNISSSCSRNAHPYERGKKSKRNTPRIRYKFTR